MTWLLIPFAYLIGSISFAVVVSKCMRLPDPYSYGSGNPGATNVLRTGNKRAAVLTLLGDALKGFLAVMVARFVLGEAAVANDAGAWIMCGVVIAVFLGHLYPVFHGFKGGKGVATACGILFGINLTLGSGNFGYVAHRGFLFTLLLTRCFGRCCLWPDLFYFLVWFSAYGDCSQRGLCFAYLASSEQHS
jgi:acyl phosphate:glycerol-3-phosphate acyltransferase